MTGLVLDCSVAVTWCFEDEARPETDALLSVIRDKAPWCRHSGIWNWAMFWFRPSGAGACRHRMQTDILFCSPRYQSTLTSPSWAAPSPTSWVLHGPKA